MKLSDIIDTASRLAALRDQADALRDTVKADTPTLDALRQAVNGWGVLRNRDALTVEATGAEWDYTPHSSGAYLVATVYVLVTRDNTKQRGQMTVRITTVRDGDTVTAPEWQTHDGRTLTYSAHIAYAVLPDAARKIIDAKLRETWDDIAPAVPVLWNEAVTYQAANAVRSNTLHAVESLARQVLAVAS